MKISVLEERASTAQYRNIPLEEQTEHQRQEAVLFGRHSKPTSSVPVAIEGCDTCITTGAETC
eukprot:322385-Prorocentrum_lima.AAC.1